MFIVLGALLALLVLVFLAVIVLSVLHFTGDTIIDVVDVTGLPSAFTNTADPVSPVTVKVDSTLVHHGTSVYPSSPFREEHHMRLDQEVGYTFSGVSCSRSAATGRANILGIFTQDDGKTFYASQWDDRTRLFGLLPITFCDSGEAVRLSPDGDKFFTVSNRWLTVYSYNGVDGLTSDLTVPSPGVQVLIQSEWDGNDQLFLLYADGTFHHRDALAATVEISTTVIRFAVHGDYLVVLESNPEKTLRFWKRIEGVWTTMGEDRDLTLSTLGLQVLDVVNYLSVDRSGSYVSFVKNNVFETEHIMYWLHWKTPTGWTRTRAELGSSTGIPAVLFPVAHTMAFRSGSRVLLGQLDGSTREERVLFKNPTNLFGVDGWALSGCVDVQASNGSLVLFAVAYMHNEVIESDRAAMCCIRFKV